MFKDDKSGEVFATKKYEQFRHFGDNRDVYSKNSEPHIRALVRSIKKKNMLADKPILVDKEFHIIDGQHRLEAAKRLQETIYYRFATVVGQDDVAQLNTFVKKWQPSNYLHKYCKRKNLDYQKFSEFMLRHQLSLTATLTILTKVYKTSGMKDFKDGNFKYPNNDTYANMVGKRITNFEEFFPRIRKYTRWILAIIDISKDVVEYDNSWMMKQLKKYVEKEGLSQDRRTRPEFVKYLEKIYNFGLTSKDKKYCQFKVRTREVKARASSGHKPKLVNAPRFA